jgi:hypothetical protein
MDRNELNEKAKNAAWTAVMNCAAGDRLSTSEAHLLVKEAIRAYLSALPGEPVAVNALEWLDRSSENEYAIRWDALTAQGGSYVIKAVHSADMIMCMGRYFSTVDAAKASAQSDYEQRIRSALTTPPASPAMDVAIEALQRLASPEAFCLPRMSTAEEIARMEFADKALATLKATRETV